MKYSEAEQSRCFMLRLEDGDVVHEALEGCARKQKIKAAALTILGGADRGSTPVVGTEKGRASPVIPKEHILADVHEISGAGAISPDESGEPRLHMHIACGRPHL